MTNGFNSCIRLHPRGDILLSDKRVIILTHFGQLILESIQLTPQGFAAMLRLCENL